MTTSRTCLSLVALITACGDLGDRARSGSCPAGEICSAATPRGLHFEGAVLGDDLLALSAPRPTLVGGAQQIRLTYDPGTGQLRDLDLPYVADDDGGAGVEVAGTSGPVVTLRGVASRSNYLRITNARGALYDRKEMSGALLTEIELLPAAREQILPGEGVVFAQGMRDLTIALHARTGAGVTTNALSSPTVRGG